MEDNGKDCQISQREVRRHHIGWHPLAWLYHGMTRWQGVRGDEGSREHGDEAELERLNEHVRLHGFPPTHFPRHASLGYLDLPATDSRGELGSLLKRRRTIRHFDRDRPLGQDEFASVLKATFGPLGQQKLSEHVVALRRSSPSGGALHPIEAYPLITNVEGIAPGLYHYRSDTHGLDLVRSVNHGDVRELAESLMIGQSYFADAQVVVFHVARLDRHHWKYRRHPKALRAVLLDSGHLSQTFYLMATQLGLGAYYTAAINDSDLEDMLGHDDARMAIGANGLGIIKAGAESLHLQPVPLA